jgi:hypothetical protein
MDRLLALRHQLGGLGLAALFLIAATAAFDVLWVNPLQSRNAQLEEQLSRDGPRAPAGAAGAAERVERVYAYLQSDAETTDWLAKLHGIGAATGVRLQSATYRSEKSAGRLVRVEVALPLSGSYLQIREFLQRALADIPVMSIDQLRLKRETRDDAALQGELRISLHMVRS